MEEYIEKNIENGSISSLGSTCAESEAEKNNNYYFAHKTSTNTYIIDSS